MEARKDYERYRKIAEKKNKISRRKFLKVAAGVAGAGTLAALAGPKIFKSFPQEDIQFYQSLKKKREYWGTLEEYQAGQKIEKAKVTNGGFPDVESVRVRSKASIGRKELTRLPVGTIIENGEIVKGGYVPRQGGETQSNRWLKFKLEIGGKEKTGYISAIYIQEIKPGETLER